MDLKPNRGNKNNEKKNFPRIVTIVIWALVLTLSLNYIFSLLRTANTEEISFTEFLTLVENDKVASVTRGEDSYIIKEKVDTSSPQSALRSSRTLYTGLVDYPDLVNVLREHDVAYTQEIPQTISPIVSFLLTWILPMVLMFGLLSLLFRNMGSRMGGGLGGVGKANAKVYVEKKTGVTFADVAGQDEAKESLEEIIDFLHNPQKYTAIGAKLPKGALLVGSPGTGKTLLARAVAGEANVPFFSISGSDFVEMFVGVGASRVRDLFQQAAKMAPCIIFIDEIDTIGKSRDASRFGGNDEREQTLNQLLAELDGFDPTKGVIVLAATNRPEVLDKALLRPGRFDRRITVDRPNLAGRLATLQVHTRSIRLAEDVDLNRIAQATAGAVGADLANLVNEAALRAVRMGRYAVNQEDLLVSFEVVIAGTEKKGTVLTEKEKKIIAFHEVGHAMVAAKQKHAQPVQKITIVPHTQGALGYTMQLPEEEKFLMSKDDLLTEIRTLLAGRAAEQVVFQTQTTGAANDIERATDIARKLITQYGMSDEFGMVALGTVQSQFLEGTATLNCAQETFAAVDQAVMRIIAQCHQDAIAILQENREMLDRVASYLLKKETITGQEMMAILEGRDPELADTAPAPSASANEPVSSALVGEDEGDAVPPLANLDSDDIRENDEPDAVPPLANLDSDDIRENDEPDAVPPLVNLDSDDVRENDEPSELEGPDSSFPV
ncbi:MAG: ATP-dependent zinc metalloprotease FtsH [Oscillospiraceae bacterium]|nr:ATP-dependent zinc metalloprotease FtsH [Oscillospiraceae bacterium]